MRRRKLSLGDAVTGLFIVAVIIAVIVGGAALIGAVADKKDENLLDTIDWESGPVQAALGMTSPPIVETGEETRCYLSTTSLKEKEIFECRDAPRGNGTSGSGGTRACGSAGTVNSKPTCLLTAGCEWAPKEGNPDLEDICVCSGDSCSYAAVTMNHATNDNHVACETRTGCSVSAAEAVSGESSVDFSDPRLYLKDPGIKCAAGDEIKSSSDCYRAAKEATNSSLLFDLWGADQVAGSESVTPWCSVRPLTGPGETSTIYFNRNADADPKTNVMAVCRKKSLTG